MTPAASASGRLATALRSRRRSAGVGDAAGFAAVYERHHQALYRYCRSILQHDQDAQDELRTRDAPVDEQVSLRAELQHLHQDLETLPERQRAALVLRELNGLSHGEIAQVLDCTPRSVKQFIYEARTGLMQAREGREMACETIRRRLSDGDGRVLRGARMRAHLRSCPACRRFQEELVQRPRELAMLAPPLPITAGAALMAQLLPATGAATMAAFAPKAVATIAVIVAAAGGTAAVRHTAPTHAPQRPAEAQEASATASPRTAPGDAARREATPAADGGTQAFHQGAEGTPPKAKGQPRRPAGRGGR